MAEQHTATSAPFPTPPPFYQHFTKQNLAALRQARKEVGLPRSKLKSQNTSEVNEGLDILSLPAELRYLIPPKPPSDGRYTSFGAEFDLNAPPPTLASQGVEQLYPAHASAKLNPQPHLIALTRSMLTSFLSLIGILGKNPELFQSKLDDMQIMMYNMHELINHYRPHQARESLILSMEERIEKLGKETQKIAESKLQVETLLRELSELRDDPMEVTLEESRGRSDTRDAGGGNREREQRAAWAALADVFPAKD